jgi:transposase
MQKKELALQIVNPYSAGIDVGSRSYFVAVDQNAGHVKEFGVYTKDHLLLIAHLREAGVTTIAMESTGSYWQTLFNALQSAGFEVVLVNGSQTKNVKGKKTDVVDCLWIQKLHSLGLLSGSFILSDHLQQLRTYFSHRQHLIEQTSKYTHKMQKALRLMNIRLDIALNDIAGKSGMAIIKAILAGERDPHHLAALVSNRTKKSREEIAVSLHGQWRPDLLFELQACLSLYNMYEQAILECDRQLEAALLAHVPVNGQQAEQPSLSLKGSRRMKVKRGPSFNVQQIAFAYFRTDLYEIPCVSHTTILCLLTNMGNDLPKFASAKQFASWLRLVPDNKISGGRVISNKTPSGKNQIAHSLRQAANTIGNQKAHPLTPFFKRIAYRRGRIAAITATARKLAIIIWNMITKREPYRHFDYEKANQKNKIQQLKNIQHRLLKLNLNTDELKTLFQRTSPSIT